MGQPVVCKKASGGNGKGLRHKHGDNTGKNRSGFVRADFGQGPIVPIKEVVQVPVEVGEGHFVSQIGTIRTDRPVKPEAQEGLLRLKAQLVAQNS